MTISDVGMIMMQTGMVKQSVDYTSSFKALDGTIFCIKLANYQNYILIYFQKMKIAKKKIETKILIFGQHKSFKKSSSRHRSHAQC